MIYYMYVQTGCNPTTYISTPSYPVDSNHHCLHTRTCLLSRKSGAWNSLLYLFHNVHAVSVPSARHVASK